MAHKDYVTNSHFGVCCEVCPLHTFSDVGDRSSTTRLQESLDPGSKVGSNCHAMTTAAVQAPSSRAASMVGTRTESDWTARAACRDTDPDELFVQGAAQNRAKTRCFGCIVRTECLADALDNRVEFGVWGGMTERERRALLRRRPDVVSWSDLLETARAEALGRTAV
jgi:WhiB family redox-sensing transcriptional regulator